AEKKGAKPRTTTKAKPVADKTTPDTNEPVQTAEEKAAKKLEAKRAAEEAKRDRLEKAKLKREETERKAQLREEEKRRAAEEKAQRKAEREAKAAQTARLKAERAEQKRLEDEKKASEREEKKRLAAEKKARLEAERQEKARIREQKREEKRRAEEEIKARRLAKAEAKRLAAEEAERIKQEKAEQKRRELELEAELKAEQERKHAEEFARLKEQKAAEKAHREALDRAARERATQEELRIETLKAEQRRLEAEEIARIQAEKMYQLKQQNLATKIPERRAKVRPSKPNLAADMAQRDLPLPLDLKEEGKPTVNPQEATPEPISGQSGNQQDKSRPGRKEKPLVKPRRVSGAPNFFTLKPYRHTSAIRQRALRSAQIKPMAFGISLVASLALLILCVRYVLVPPATVTAGPSAIAINQHSQLLLVVGDQLLMHDRAGVGTYTRNLEALGLATLSPPLVFTAQDALLVQGKTPSTDIESVPPQLFSCSLKEPACQVVNLSPEIAQVTDLTIGQRSGSLYIADAQSKEIFKTKSTGELLSRAKVGVPAAARIRLHQGLIYLNSDVAPAISVFRPDAQAFGTQLDEILLLPPTAVEAEQTQVSDFTWSSESWWVSLINPETRSTGVYRFDSQWNFLEEVVLEENTFPDRLQTWADKTLVLDAHRVAIQRFNANGEAEVPVRSNSAEAQLDEERKSRQLSGAIWRASLIALILIAAAGLWTGNLHRLRNLVYRQGNERGAEPIVDREKEVTWVPNTITRDQHYKKVAVAYLAFSLITLISTGTLSPSTPIVLALGIALIGPLIGLFLMYTAHTGHIGVLGTQLLLVDHHNFYHLGSGPRIFYRKHFVMLDDILVFTGTGLLPVFDIQHLRKNIQPIVTAGIKVDRKTLLVKLIESAHPILKSSIAIMGCLGIAALILLAA
ncbi:MAG: hypothetical protein AB8B81_22070, partial [Halioglobus sp.]